MKRNLAKKLFILFLLLNLLSPLAGRSEEFLGQPEKMEIKALLDTVEVSWQNPDSKFFSSTVLFRSNIPIEDFFTYEAVAGLCDQIYEGTDNSYLDAGLAPNLSYYYILFARDWKGNYSRAAVAERKPWPEDKNQPLSNLAGADSDVVNNVSKTEAGLVYNYNGPLELDENARRLSLFIIVKGPASLKQQDKNAISYFIQQGTPTTILLGSGERAGVLNSYLAAFAKLPTNELDWQDVIKIGNGRWPDERNPDAEARAAGTYFRTVYQRLPDLNDPHDSAAVTVIAYGLRPAERNLESEKKAILIFRSVFGYQPSAAADWDIVRAIAYSGAVRKNFNPG